MRLTKYKCKVIVKPAPKALRNIYFTLAEETFLVKTYGEKCTRYISYLMSQAAQIREPDLSDKAVGKQLGYTERQIGKMRRILTQKNVLRRIPWTTLDHEKGHRFYLGKITIESELKEKVTSEDDVALTRFRRNWA